MRDIVERLMDFEDEGITGSDRYHLRKDAAFEIARLRNALKVARDGLRNDFEPDNQSRAYKTVDAALNPK
jgi:hypothetical protein